MVRSATPAQQQYNDTIRLIMIRREALIAELRGIEKMLSEKGVQYRPALRPPKGKTLH